GEVVEGEIAVGDKVTLTVAQERRQQIAGNHTATHLLQAALRSVLGDHVKQSGSLVEPERLRFDFTNFAPVTAEELLRVEQIVNAEIRRNTPVETVLKSRDEAVAEGATALFGEKYGDSVRVVSVGDYSSELCGGTHVAATGAIGLLKVVTETGIAAGVRRIEAITGASAFARFQTDEAELAGLAELVNASGSELRSRIEKLLSRQKELEKEVGRLTAAQTIGNLDSLVDAAQTVAGVKVVAAEIPLDSPKTMREVGDRVRDKLGSGIAVLGGVFQGKVVLLVMVSKDLTKQFQAGKIVKEVAAIVGGGGGGRPDMAQAGGSDIAKLPEAIAAVAGIVAGQA
ncbi:MAG: DHHA1 domain-containing protein, partial [Desulfuromonadales bacterium]|nr:DHHA1 domain-containing protein [Desulfuromonadales bacterium]